MHFKTLFLCTALVTPAVSAQPTGTWGTPRQHDVSVAPGFLHAPPTGGMGQRFKALHLALIPQPSANAGLVIGWDSQDQDGSGGGWYQRWTVLDPSTDPPTILWNDELYIPGAGSGDLFCSGHAWTSDGRLFVAGGTSFYPSVGGGPFSGAKIALLFDPTPTGLEPYGRWSLLAPMAKDRWYPTVTLDGNGMMVVTGGSHQGGGENTYEVYDPATNTWQTDPATGNSFFPGPTGGAQLHNFRRMHVLSEGELFMSGPQTQAARVDHNLAPGVWTLTGQSSVHRHDGASILFPFPFNVPDVVVILGGSSGPMHSNPPDTVEYCLPQQTPAPWAFGAPMNRKRVHLNVVVLPDATVLAVGGHDVNVFWKDAEWLDNTFTWVGLATGASTRDYHSTALLLPDGNVLSAGGDNRDWDYQLLSPPYFDNPALPPPTNVTLSTTNLAYLADGGGLYTANFTLPAGSSISRVVLMAPGSTTHHSDMGQRYTDLPIAVQTPGSVTFYPPYNNCAAPNPLNFCAPPGYYMLFLVTDQGVPSNATIVKL